MEQPDHDIVVRFTQGDALAFTAIYNEYYPAIYYFVRRFMQERENAEDITADVFVKLWKMHANIEGINNIKAFLYVAARNTSIDFLRYQQKQNKRQQDLLHALLQEQADVLLKEDVKTEVLKLIYEEIENLPKSCRKVFKMAYLEGLSNSEIAETLKINNQSVRNHKQQAIKVLRIALLHRNLLVGAIIGCYCSVLHVLD